MTTIRTREQEEADLAVRLMDGGLPETSARKEAKRITAVIWNCAITAAVHEITPDGVSYTDCCDDHAARNAAREEIAEDVATLKIEEK